MTLKPDQYVGDQPRRQDLDLGSVRLRRQHRARRIAPDDLKPQRPLESAMQNAMGVPYGARGQRPGTLAAGF
jgi:hypothetical protein